MLNNQCHKLSRKLSLVLTTTVLINSFAVLAYADNKKPSDVAEGPFRPTVVGKELVYPDGVMVSIDAGTGLPQNQRAIASQEINLNSVSRSRVIPCSRGYTCLYDNIFFGGRRLQWRDRGQRINLTRYNFNNKLSSWNNRNSVDARWFYNVNDFNNLGASRCMNSNSFDRVVGFRDNDKASALAIYTDRRAC